MINFDLKEFIDNLIIYDYMLFGAGFILFLLLLILAILLRKKIGFAIFLIILAFSIFVLSPTVGYVELHKYLFKNTTELLSQKKLTFTKAVVIKGKIINNSKFNFTTCKITANAYKITKNKYKNYILKLKPFQKMSIDENDIQKGQSRTFKIIMEPFYYKKDYNISLEAKCKGVVK